MKKKLLSLALALVMCLSLYFVPALLSTPAWADQITDPYISIETANGENTTFNPSTQKELLSGKGWIYTPSPRTLTLDGFKGERIIAYRAGNLVIELKGDNVCSSLFRISDAGLLSETNITTITGNGTLTTSNVDFGADVTMKSGTITSNSSARVISAELIISGGTFNSTNGYNWGLELSTASLKMSSGTLTVTGVMGFGIKGGNGSKISLEGGTVTAQGRKAAIWLDWLRNRKPGVLSINAGKITGGETAKDTQTLSIREAENEECHVITVAASELTVSEGWGYDWAQSSGAAKYVHIESRSQNNPPSTEPTPSVPSNTAYSSTQNVGVDGKTVEFQCYALKDEKGYLTNYMMLRDVAHVLRGTGAQFSVGWDGPTSTITATSGGVYQDVGSEMNTPFSGNRTYTVSASKLMVNGKAVDVTAILLKDDKGGGYTYFKLRDLGQALNFNVSWSAEKGIYINTDQPYSDAN